MLNAQSFLQSVKHLIHFRFVQNTQFVFQFDGRNTLNLLQVKSAGFQKQFGNGKLPAVATQRSGMEKDGNEIKFVVCGIAGEQQGGTQLCRQPEIHRPDLTAVGDEHLPPPYGRASLRLPARPGHIARCPHSPPPIRSVCGEPPGVRFQSAWATRSKFQPHSCWKSNANGSCWQALQRRQPSSNTACGTSSSLKSFSKFSRPSSSR